MSDLRIIKADFQCFRMFFSISLALEKEAYST